MVSRVVDHPEMVMVQIDNENDIIHVTLEVDKNDLGKVIGRSGTTAWALRTLIQAVAMKLGKRASFKIVE
ncbi:MAG TPA: KH domain-containing protein [Firmicutes bacterium]|nr:KH domain-containing protein [Bacillota bacterium]